MVNNYRLVSLLLIYSKISEKLIFHNIYEFIDKNNLLNNNHSGFRANDSCIHQLIAITQKNINALDANPSLEVFLNLSKAIEFGMTVFFINSRVMELTVTSLNLLNRF